MRQTSNNRRGRGRGNGRKPAGRHHTFDSNGPSVRVRGTAPQLHEKYLTMARDAAASGDRIMAENYYQHADHYYRILNANNPEQNAERAPQRRGGGEAEPAAEADKSHDQPPEKAAANGRRAPQRQGNGRVAAEDDATSKNDAKNDAKKDVKKNDGEDAEIVVTEKKTKPTKAAKTQASTKKTNGEPPAEAEDEPAKSDKGQAPA